jgi:hypothetical protein
MESVPITTKFMSLNTAHGEVYLIQHYVIKFVSDLMQVCGFLRVQQFLPPINSLPVSRVRIFFFFFVAQSAIFLSPEFSIRLYDKNSESEYFFQQHWESEYFFRKKP